MSIKINADNYNTYKRVYEIISHHLYKDLSNLLSSDSNPVTVLNNWEAKSKSLAKRGLQAGLNDCLSSVSYYPAATFQEINAELDNNNLPNLYTLTGSIQKTIRKVLKTKKIQHIDQYYIVKELLDDTTSEITEDDRKTLSACLYDFGQATNR
jgi:hypothetical protein